MKKIVILASAAVLALASCAKTEVVPTGAQQKITFRQFNSAMTTKAETSLGTDVSLGVFANLNDDNSVYFGNSEFAHNNGFWTGNKYWPLSGALDFTVYAPYTEGTTFDNNKLTVTVKNNLDTQTDYMYGKERYLDKNKPNGSEEQGVKVVLKHALSKVTIKVKASAEDVFTLTSLQMSMVQQQGSFVVDYTNPNNPTVNVTPTDGENFSQTKEFITAETTLDNNYTTAKEIGSILVIPSEQGAIRIKYKLAGSEKEMSLTHSLFGNYFESGKHYTFNIIMTANEIRFSPTVDDWTEETAKDIEVM